MFTRGTRFWPIPICLKNHLKMMASGWLTWISHCHFGGEIDPGSPGGGANPGASLLPGLGFQNAPADVAAHQARGGEHQAGRWGEMGWISSTHSHRQYSNIHHAEVQHIRILSTALWRGDHTRIVSVSPDYPRLFERGILIGEGFFFWIKTLEIWCWCKWLSTPNFTLW